MAFELFGYQIGKKSKQEEEITQAKSFAPPASGDGAMLVSEGSFYGTVFDVNGGLGSEADLITRYREMSLYPDVEYAVDDIVNEAITLEDGKDVVSFNMDNFEEGSVFAKPALQKKITQEFKRVSELLDLNNSAYEIFKRWYVDGRINYHIIPAKNPKIDGIIELRYVDPRKVRKVKQVKRVDDTKAGAVLFQTSDEYYVYSSAGFGKSVNDNINQKIDSTVYGLKISPDAMIYTHSGLTDPSGNMILSYLHKAMRVLNSLKSLEDSLVIYRFTRAPERKIFYIEVGQMPRQKAEQYMNDMMTKYKNKLVFDPSTGKMADDRRLMTATEDFWLPRRDGKGTEVQTLQGGQNLGELSDINYFQSKLYRALGVPVSRMNSDTSGFTFSKAAEISRDEIKFSKFIDRLRRRFSMLLFEALSKQLIMKNIITVDDVPELYRGGCFEFASDNHFTEVKNNEILSRRVEIAKEMQDFTGHYFSHEYVRKKIFKQTDEEMEEIDSQIVTEKENEQYQFGTDFQPGMDPNMMGGSDPSMMAPQDGAEPPFQDSQQPIPQDDKLINSTK